MLFIGAIFSTALLSSGVTLWLANGRPSSSLTEGLRGKSWDQSTAIFDARLKQQFPMGTSQTDLTGQLQREGFLAEWPSNDPEHEAVRSEGDFVCNIAARVFWQVDQAQRIKAIKGQYREEGCL